MTERRKVQALLVLCGLVLLLAVLAGRVVGSRPQSPPSGLTSYGRIVWNLDALVRDSYGGAGVCFRREDAAIHRCRMPRFNDGFYRVTFATARRSRFRARALRMDPLRETNVLSVTIDGRYISCERMAWLAITNAPAGFGEQVECVHE